MFPTIYAIAMDYLPIQASAVPCERVFSSSAETCTKKRNRLDPAMVEALQMLKFALKKERLNFTKGWGSSQKDMLWSEVPYNADTVDILASFANGDSSAVDTLLSTVSEQELDNIPDQAEIFLET
jgi:hypothetical protein